MSKLIVMLIWELSRELTFRSRELNLNSRELRESSREPQLSSQINFPMRGWFLEGILY